MIRTGHDLHFGDNRMITSSVLICPEGASGMTAIGPLFLLAAIALTPVAIHLLIMGADWLDDRRNRKLR